MISENIFNYITLGWTAVAVATFVFLLFVTAPYGRYTKTGWGKLVDNRLGWIVMEFPSFAIILYFLVAGIRSPYAIFGASLWLLHYVYRTFIFPFRLHTDGKKMPLSILLSAVGFNSVNAFLNGYFLINFESYSSSWFLHPLTLIGITLFISGTIIHILSDKILISLRKPGETGYKIPKGFLFRYVSCPNFLGEIVVWIGFVMIVPNLASLSFLIWTIANVVPRGIKHHQWYKNKFEEYPKNRKAIFPFIL
jgi:3-oxo-5-alpha-steroid 4-dehydrogenase 1